MHPILFEIPTPWGPQPIFSYGVMLGTSMISAWYIVMWLGERDGMNKDILANGFIAAAISAIVGSRVLYIATNPGEFDTIFSWFNLRAGGLVAYGGFLGGFFGSLAYFRSKGISLLRFADITAPTLALGLGLTRIGCYLYGCDFGAPLSDDAPAWLRGWGTFPHWANDEGSPAWSHHVSAYDHPFDSHFSMPCHPTQIYESLAGFTLCAITIVMWRRREFYGQVLLALAIAYGFWRFGIEYVRDDPERGAFAGFSTSQLISLGIVPVAGFFYFKQRAEHRLRPTPVYKLSFDDPPAVVAEPAASKNKSGAADDADGDAEEREPSPSPTSSTARGKSGIKKPKKKK
jgi:phosphatidylglycerol:prolipoprotein diacylglycerol transferase